MAGSVSPKPSFYLCPDFNIAPPPNGHLQLGSILKCIDVDGVLTPLNFGATVEVPQTELLPKDGPEEKRGFVRSIKELRSVEGSIWAKIFGWEGLGAAFSFLRKRQDDETLKVEKLFIQYFIPTPGYMKQALESNEVAFYVKNTKMKKPVYLITGLMWTEGATLSKIQSDTTKIDGQVAGTDPNSGTTVGAKWQYQAADSLSSSFDGSKPFILGIRVRKIWWDKNGTRQDKTDFVGAKLAMPEQRMPSLLKDLRFADDEHENSIAHDVFTGAKSENSDSIVWVLS